MKHKINKSLTFAYVNERLSYEPATGLLRWKLMACNRAPKVGSVAGHRHKTHGYVRVKINRRIYQAHRIAWLLATGKWPAGGLDHIDLNPANNRLENLREATDTQQQQNTPLHRTSKTGFRGVSLVKRKRTMKYRALVTVDGVQKHLGTYETAAEAGEVCRQARLKHFGEFAPLAERNP